jgi:hypothetical protein
MSISKLAANYLMLSSNASEKSSPDSKAQSEKRNERLRGAGVSDVIAVRALRQVKRSRGSA